MPKMNNYEMREYWSDYVVRILSASDSEDLIRILKHDYKDDLMDITGMIVIINFVKYYFVKVSTSKKIVYFP